MQVSRSDWVIPLLVGVGLLGVSAALVLAFIPLTAPPFNTDWQIAFSAAEHAAGDALAARLRPPTFVGIAVGLLAVAALGFTGAGARLVELAARSLGGGIAAQVVLGSLAVLAVLRLATLPVSAWRERILVDVGLSTRTWGGWFGDVIRSFGVNYVVTVAALALFVTLVKFAPRLWWVAAAGAAFALTLALSFAYPLIIEPIFNDFESMPPGQLRSDLLDLAQSDGIAVNDVLIADQSRRTSTLNAYVSGFGDSRRIVVYDTLLDTLPPEQVEAVVAHELGHVKNRDVLTGTLIGAISAAALVCLLAALVAGSSLTSRFDGVGDPRALATLLALVALLGFVAGPIESALSRRVEWRADQHALELYDDPGVLAELHRNLAVQNKSDLDPPALIYWWFASHPTAVSRIAEANSR